MKGRCTKKTEGLCEERDVRTVEECQGKESVVEGRESKWN